MTDNRQPTSCFFTSQNLRLHYLDWGNHGAPLLILQHGGFDHARSMDWIARELADEWHVIAPDLRGHGDSAWSVDAAYNMAAYIFDFANLIEALGQDKVTICAHSLGAMITTRFAGIYPERVVKFVNIEGLSVPSKPIRCFPSHLLPRGCANGWPCTAPRRCARSAVMQPRSKPAKGCGKRTAI
jgi:pimeloyl-ACP methyl ester carboxylesterase